MCQWCWCSPTRHTTPLSSCHEQCVTRRYGCLWNPQRIFQRHLAQQKRMCMPFEWIGTIMTKYQPLGEDSDGKSPSFLQHLPQVSKVGHTIDRPISNEKNYPLCSTYIFHIEPQKSPNAISEDLYTHIWGYILRGYILHHHPRSYRG